MIEDSGYVSRPDQIEHIAGSAEAVARLNGAGFVVVVVTNQSGVGRGYYSWDEFCEVQAAIEARLTERGAWLDGVWACGHHEDDHRSRKPNPGMLEDAAEELGLRLDVSWMVGDRVSDVEAGLRAGLAGVIHVQTGAGPSVHEEVSEMAKTHASGARILQCENLAQAVGLILGKPQQTRKETER